MITLRIIKEGSPDNPKPMSDPKAVYDVMKFLKKADREKLYALHLNGQLQIVAQELISVGTLSYSSLSPREVFKGAILHNSTSIILVHSHPNGSFVPSKVDLEITKKLTDVGKLLEIPLVDHIIIGDEGFCSIVMEQIFIKPVTKKQRCTKKSKPKRKRK